MMRCLRWCVCILCISVAALVLLQTNRHRSTAGLHLQHLQSLQGHAYTQETRRAPHSDADAERELAQAQGEKNLVFDEKYMNFFGFGSRAGSGNEEWRDASAPTIVSYVSDERYFGAAGLIKNVAAKMPNRTLLVYDIGVKKRSLADLNCNATKCAIINFDLGMFPSHVSEERLHAFRPLIIQDALNRVGGIVFIESDRRFVGESGRLDDLYGAAAEGAGVVAWPTRPAVSSLTHPKMFEYFHTYADNFLFLPMVEAVHLVIVRSPSVTDRVMMPWVRCALTQDCIFPIGAQSDGCRFDKKPQYRYSGCHSFDASALSIVLGLRYNLDESHYVYKGTEVLFRKVSDDEAYREFLHSEKNSTVPPREDSEIVPQA